MSKTWFRWLTVTALLLIWTATCRGSDFGEQNRNLLTETNERLQRIECTLEGKCPTLIPVSMPRPKPPPTP